MEWKNCEEYVLSELAFYKKISEERISPLEDAKIELEKRLLETEKKLAAALAENAFYKSKYFHAIGLSAGKNETVLFSETEPSE